jgi:hypothetical protein
LCSCFLAANTGGASFSIDVVVVVVVVVLLPVGLGSCCFFIFLSLSPPLLIVSCVCVCFAAQKPALRPIANTKNTTKKGKKKTRQESKVVKETLIQN